MSGDHDRGEANLLDGRRLNFNGCFYSTPRGIQVSGMGSPSSQFVTFWRLKFQRLLSPLIFFAPIRRAGRSGGSDVAKIFVAP